MTGAAAPAGWSFPLRTMQAVGIELEYMIVDRETLDVAPIADRLLREAAGAADWVSDFEPAHGEGIGWSNELVNHVFELKTASPVDSFDGLAGRFQRQVAAADRRLAAFGARLMPGAMHPWMDPLVETRLWTHEQNPVYERYDAIFSCRGHGWSNLQSSHLNLPFGDDLEFGRLHAAVRLVLPLLPALAASSPVMDGERTGIADSRLAAYRQNCRKIPSITGQVIPEPVYDRSAYERVILDRIERDVRPFDPEGVLRPDFTNSRGAIARFDRGSIEIRVLDVQEHPAADLAIAELACRTISALLDERWVSLEEVGALPTRGLVEALEATIRDAEHAVVRHPGLLRALGVGGDVASAGRIWAEIGAALPPGEPELAAPLRTLVTEGSLSTRISQALDGGRCLRDVYEELCDCLLAGRSFV